MIHLTFERDLPSKRLLLGDVFVSEGAPPRSAVVLVHGFKGFKDWGFFPILRRRLASAGHAVVCFNFSGAGVGRDLLRFTDLEGFARNTLSAEAEELARVVEWVRAGDLLPRTPRTVGVLGHSRGGGQAVLLPGLSGTCDALVTWSSVGSFDRWSEETRREWRAKGRIHVMNSRTGQQMPLDVTLLEDFERNRSRLDVRAAARSVEAPWLIVHGDEDLTVAPDEARALAREAPHARLVLIESAGHTYEVGHPCEVPSPQLLEAVEATERHFARYLLGEDG